MKRIELYKFSKNIYFYIQCARINCVSYVALTKDHPLYKYSCDNLYEDDFFDSLLSSYDFDHEITWSSFNYFDINAELTSIEEFPRSTKMRILGIDYGQPDRYPSFCLQSEDDKDTYKQINERIYNQLSFMKSFTYNMKQFAMKKLTKKNSMGNMFTGGIMGEIKNKIHGKESDLYIGTFGDNLFSLINNVPYFMKQKIEKLARICYDYEVEHNKNKKVLQKNGDLNESK